MCAYLCALLRSDKRALMRSYAYLRAVTGRYAQFGQQLHPDVRAVWRAVMIRWAHSYVQLRAVTGSYAQ